MSVFQADSTTVGEIVAQVPGRSRVFQKLGIDFCCGGKKPLAQACAEKGLDIAEVLRLLESSDAPAGEVDPATMTMTELADHIQNTHHAYLREELPRLQQMANRVATVHGKHDARLVDVASVLNSFVDELASHMMKEEQILFPMIRHLDRTSGPISFHCGSLANPIRMMEYEHESAGNGLERMRALTDDYTPPDWACNTYRATLAGLAQLEADMHVHVHKENNVLFPRAVAAEQERV